MAAIDPERRIVDCAIRRCTRRHRGGMAIDEQPVPHGADDTDYGEGNEDNFPGIGALLGGFSPSRTMQSAGWNLAPGLEFLCQIEPRPSCGAGVAGKAPAAQRRHFWILRCNSNFRVSRRRTMSASSSRKISPNSKSAMAARRLAGLSCALLRRSFCVVCLFLSVC